MEGSVKDVSQQRFSCAKENIERNGEGAIRKSRKDFTDVRTKKKKKMGNSLEFSGKKHYCCV